MNNEEHMWTHMCWFQSRCTRRHAERMRALKRQALPRASHSGKIALPGSHRLRSTLPRLQQRQASSRKLLSQTPKTIHPLPLHSKRKVQCTTIVPSQRPTFKQYSTIGISLLRSAARNASKLGPRPLQRPSSMSSVTTTNTREGASSPISFAATINVKCFSRMRMHLTQRIRTITSEEGQHACHVQSTT